MGVPLSIMYLIFSEFIEEFNATNCKIVGALVQKL